MSDTEVEIEPPKPEQEVEVETTTTETPEKTEPKVSKTPDQGEDIKAAFEAQKKELEALKEREAESKRKEREALDYASRAMREAQQTREQYTSTEQLAVDNALAAAQAELDAAKRSLKEALTSGDFEKVPDLQEQVSVATTKRLQAEQYKENLAARPRQEPPRHADPIDNVLSRYTGPTREWLSKHRELFRSDGSLKAVAYAAHEKAQDQNIRADTPEYFDFIERDLGYKKDATVAAQQPVTMRASMPAAPVSRETSATSATSKTKVKLSAGEAQAATDGTLVWNTGPNKGKPIGIEEMAKRKQELMKNDKYRQAS